MKPCQHDPPLLPPPGRPWSTEYCRLCWLYEHESAYRALWQHRETNANDHSAGRTTSPSLRHLPCRFLDGEKVFDRRDRLCPHCWVRGCELFERCTTGVAVEGIPCCRTCRSYQPDDDSTDRPVPQPLLLSNRLSPGDVLVMSAAVESLHNAYPGHYLTAVSGTASAIWENNPLTLPLHPWEAAKARRIEMEYPLIHHSNQRPIHFLQGYCDFLAEQLGTAVPLTVNRPRLYLGAVERQMSSQVEEITGRPTKFWVLNAGVKTDFTTKNWGQAAYQEVVDRLRGKILFVQVGQKHHRHRRLDGVIDLIGQTDTRQLIRLCWHAEGGLGPTTFLQHIMAAWQKPYVCILGGREPVSWTHYTTQITLSTAGQLQCCRTSACWKARVVPLHDGSQQDHSLCEQPLEMDEPRPRCLALIEPEQVVQAVEGFYKGGVLSS